ncbi:MAG TPA: Ig-like domain-containing protein, partial [Planctomycetota bacterium]|nr:Ig-like domain-containing protein [Planctomycetota bacterium]
MKNRVWAVGSAIVLLAAVMIFSYVGCGGGGGSSGSSGGSSAPNPPAQAASPVPANGQVSRPLAQQLSWSAATGATSYDIYFGTTSTGWSVVATTTGLTYNPGALSSSTDYYWRISSRNSGGTTAGLTWSFSTGDFTLPTVASTGPVASATNIAINTVITVTFSKVMSASTISATTFTLSNALGSVTGTVTCTSATITFTPVIALMGGTVYTATVTTGVKDSAGNALAADYIWTFTTPYSRFAYVANYSDNTISCYTLNNSTGQLRYNGYVTAGTQPWSVAVDPSGQFVYAANFGSSNISVYKINPVTGALSQTAGSPVASGANPRAVAVDPTGR